MKDLKKILEGYEKKALIGLVLELAKLRKDNMAWLETKLQVPEKFTKSVEHYREKIQEMPHGQEAAVDASLYREKSC